MERIPFHSGLFYYAMIGLVGRVPNNKVVRNKEGYYDFWYFPKDDKEKKALQDYVTVIAEWLDHFEILFSQSRCEYGIAPINPGGPEMLQVRIRLPSEALPMGSTNQ